MNEKQQNVFDAGWVFTFAFAFIIKISLSRFRWNPGATDHPDPHANPAHFSRTGKGCRSDKRYAVMAFDPSLKPAPLCVSGDGE